MKTENDDGFGYGLELAEAGRMSRQRKRDAVLRLAARRGSGDGLSRSLGVTAATLTQWR